MSTDDKPRVIAGIDVGLTGGLVLMSADYKIVASGLLPVRPFPEGGNRGVKNRIDAFTLHNMLSPPPFTVIKAFVEDPGIVTRGSLAGASLHNSFGSVLSVLEVLEVPVHLLRAGGSKGWKGVYGLDQLRGMTDTEKKARSMSVAIGLMPGLSFLRKKDHGVAEAALIARFGIKYFGPFTERANATPDIG